MFKTFNPSKFKSAGGVTPNIWRRDSDVGGISSPIDHTSICWAAYTACNINAAATAAPSPL